MPTELPPTADMNIALFRDTGVVSDYANLSGPRDCEAFLFATYIAPGSDVLDLGVGAGGQQLFWRHLPETIWGLITRKR